MSSFDSFHFGNKFFSNGRSVAARGFSLLALAFLVGGVPMAHAATNVVTVCDQASLQSAVASGGTIQFGCDATIVLTNTLIISQNTVIDGVGHNITISGNDSVRVFKVDSGVSFALANLTVSNGKLARTNIASPDQFGAGLFNNGGNVVLSGVTFVTNAVRGGDTSSIGGRGLGGAIYQTGGSLVGTNCVFVGNKATGGYGGGDVGGMGAGGGIFNQSGNITLAGSVFIGNNVLGGYTADGNMGDGRGGGIYTTNGQVTLVSCQFLHNRAMTETNASTVRGGRGYTFGGAICQESGTLNLVGTDFTTNDVVAGTAARYSAQAGDGNGGAVFSTGTLNSTNCSFLGNQAEGGSGGTAGFGQGGAIYNGGVANLVRATIAGNQSIGGRGAFYTLEAFYYPSGQGNGGGIYNSNVFLMLESTLNDNIAAGGPGPFLYTKVGDGGEAYGGAIHNSGVFTGTNNTFVANLARGGDGGVLNGPASHLVGPGGLGFGGGIFNNTNGTMTLTHLSLADNAAIGGVGDTNTMGVGLGGGIVSSNGTVSLYNSIVANSTGTNCVGNTIVDGGGNISSDASVNFSASGSHTNLNPMLGTLGYYGGPTPTIPLLPGSPAIDSGLAAFCPPTDQRGVVRPFAGVCDIGAFEVVPLYTFSGKVTGVQGATVTAGSNVSVADVSGNYVITNLPGMTYLVTPSKSGYVFSPPTRQLALGADTSEVNFSAYRENTITLESWAANVMSFAFPGTVGKSYEIQSSTNLLNWVAISTNTVPASVVIQFAVTNSLADGPKYWRAVQR